MVLLVKFATGAAAATATATTTFAVGFAIVNDEPM